MGVLETMQAEQESAIRRIRHAYPDKSAAEYDSLAKSVRYFEYQLGRMLNLKELVLVVENGIPSALQYFDPATGSVATRK